MSRDTSPPQPPEADVDGPLYAGIDVGSSATKAVLLAADGRQVAQHVRRSGADLVVASETVLDMALAQIGASRSRLARIVGTGFGRIVPGAHDTRTEIGATRAARTATSRWRSR